MADTDHWVRDYFNDYYVSTVAQPANKRKQGRRAKSSVCNLVSRESSERGDSKYNEIQQEIRNLRQMLSFRSDDSEAYELRPQQSTKNRATLYWSYLN